MGQEKRLAVLGDTVGKVAGNVNWSGAVPKIFSGITIIIFVFIIAVIAFIFGYIIIQQLRFKKKIIILENVAGLGYVPSGRDRAMVVKVGDGGEEVLYLKKRKVYRTAYGKKIGKNTYAFAVGSDGYWYNVTFGDLDNKMKELGLKPVDRDMRYMHVAIRRNIKDRFDKQSILAKYGPVIAVVGSFVIMGVILWLVGSKLVELPSKISPLIDKLDLMMDKADNILAKAAAIEQGGTGLKPAWILPLLSQFSLSQEL